MSNNLSPVLQQDRIEILDILRGFAIFGILMVNMMWYNSPIASLISNNSIWTGTPDKVARFSITFLFEGKFYVLFSMLFGYGFWLFLNKKNSEGAPILRLYAMRLFILLLIGLAHVLLLWPGDILVFYALLGFVLMLFRKVKDRTLIVWTIVFITIPVIFMGFAVFIRLIPEARAAMTQAMEEQDNFFKSMISEALIVYREGSFAEMVQLRLKEYSLVLSGFLIFQALVGVVGGSWKNGAHQLPDAQHCCLFPVL